MARGVFGNQLSVTKELSSWVKKERITWVDPCLALRTAKDTDLTLNGNPWPPEEEVRGNIRDFARVGIKWMSLAKVCNNFDDMRVGKTPQSILALRYLHDIGEEVFPCLVVAPRKVKKVWQEELDKFWPGARYIIPKSGLTSAEKSLKSIENGEADIIILHWQLLPMMSKLAHYGGIHLAGCKECDPLNTNPKARCERESKSLNLINWKTVIADEVHRAKKVGGKEKGGKITRALWPVSDPAEIRFGLTGTPPEDPDELWALLRFARPLEFSSKGKFIKRYCLTKMNYFSGFEEPYAWNPVTRSELDKILDTVWIRRPKTAVHDVVEPIRLTYESEMTGQQAKAYKDLKTKMIAEIKGGVLWPDGPGARIQRLKQLASAFGEMTVEKVRNKDTGGLEDKEIMKLTEPSGKLDTLMEVLDDIDSTSAAIFAPSLQLLQLAEIRLEGKAVTLTGADSDHKSTINMKKFQDGEIPYVLYNSAASEGISLDSTDTLIIIQESEDRVVRSQAYERIYKEGRPSLIITIITPNTVEERIPRSMEEKDAKFEDLVRDEELLLQWLK